MPPYTVPTGLPNAVRGFIQRAEELRNHEPIIAYYCEFYAARKAMEVRPTTIAPQEFQIFLVALLDHLEKEKTRLSTSDAITNQDAGKAYVENFALKVFSSADNEDRAGKAGKNTARKFFAAKLFLETLNIWGELEDEIQQKLSYARWKAVDIEKALKEGRKPTPGPANGEGDMEVSDLGPGVGQFPASTDQNLAPGGPPSPPEVQSFQPGPGYPNQPSPPAPFPPAEFSRDGYMNHTGDQNFNNQPPQQYMQFPSPPNYPINTYPPQPFPPQQPAQPQPQHMATAPYGGGKPGGYGNAAPTLADLYPYDPKVLANAQKYSRFAISAIQYDDIETAVDNLQKALALLRPYSKR
ncbi:DUF605-domain-containing protein [Gonapodya prolifera JEL478]|uniref:DUF605-domain-containing protein n=1 Tax=Gonapodya prolifera (strain JEL478) TaxID=1344416 RepID=A0A139APJ1_GONPJ|nr:DUF605-domain-containing protein [Gonapodya prolifera JEL478]|eukprot:KXS18642.1 DUF605-domain-containing protein [Gonapodya prolifera JEL478]